MAIKLHMHSNHTASSLFGWRDVCDVHTHVYSLTRCTLRVSSVHELSKENPPGVYYTFRTNRRYGQPSSCHGGYKYNREGNEHHDVIISTWLCSRMAGRRAEDEGGTWKRTGIDALDKLLHCHAWLRKRLSFYQKHVSSPRWAPLRRSCNKLFRRKIIIKKVGIDTILLRKNFQTRAGFIPQHSWRAILFGESDFYR